MRLKGKKRSFVWIVCFVLCLLFPQKWSIYMVSASPKLILGSQQNRVFPPYQQRALVNSPWSCVLPGFAVFCKAPYICIQLVFHHIHHVPIQAAACTFLSSTLPLVSLEWNPYLEFVLHIIILKSTQTERAYGQVIQPILYDWWWKILLWSLQGIVQIKLVLCEVLCCC